MKALNNYISEWLIKKKVDKVKDNKTEILYTPEDDAELEEIIIDLLKNGKTDLNCIDVSKIKYMDDLFGHINKRVPVGNIDISEWDVSNVISMERMFTKCKDLECDISKWDVSNVKDTFCMFYLCKKFNCDLSDWNVSNIEDMNSMFEKCENLDCDLEKWNVNPDKCDVEDMFKNCTKMKNKLPSWYTK